ncbi:MAG: winged helix-turn-helix transcriptional regulator [Chloroflexi bacterium]|nr:winged helix-turn-helix transcriptional regulator [Chloroflexota bacterium]MBL7199047.1 winged helix-turn-helix transcriptional regulator [Anaerolineae bacterium]
MNGLATGEDFTTRLMNDMDPALLDFVKSKVNSFVKWDLIRFFHENPHTVDTADNIARYTGRHPDTVRPELDDLVESGVMNRREIGQTRIYSLVTDDEMRASIEEFIVACEDRHFRVRAVYHIIKSMR